MEIMASIKPGLIERAVSAIVNFFSMADEGHKRVYNAPHL